jgi:hypothetical protein
MSGGRLEVKVDGNASGFKHTMDTVRTQAKGAAEEVAHSWSGGLFSSIAGGIAGAFSFEAVKASLESFLGRAKEIKDMSEQFDMSTEAVQKWAKAAEDAGTQAEALFNAISAIQSKRQEALRDPKAADSFSELGVSRHDVLTQGISELAQQVFTKGLSSDEKRHVLEQIVGLRGLKAASSAKFYSTEKSAISPEAIEEAQEAKKAEQGFLNWTDSVWSSGIGFVKFVYDQLTKSQKELDMETYKHLKPGEFMGPYSDPEVLALQRRDREARIKAREDAAKNPAPKSNPDDDPLIGVENQQMMQTYLQNEEAEMGLHEAERRNMTIAGRKKSIKEDLETLRQEIKSRSLSSDSGLIYGMTQEQQSHMDQTDIQKQLHEDYLKLVGLQTKSAGLTNELRDSKGFSMEADSMARVGLYSSSSMNLNPMLELSKRQVDLLREIERNTGKNHDPHRR